MAAWQVGVKPCMEGGEFRMSSCSVRSWDSIGGVSNGPTGMHGTLAHRDGVAAVRRRVVFLVNWCPLPASGMFKDETAGC